MSIGLRIFSTSLRSPEIFCRAQTPDHTPTTPMNGAIPNPSSMALPLPLHQSLLSSTSSSTLPSLPFLFIKSLPHHRATLSQGLKKNPRRSSFVPRSISSQMSILEPPPPSPEVGGSELIASLKLKLLAAVSGLNRGLAASEEDLQSADEAAKALEAAGGPVDLTTEIDKLQGRWKLIYSSAFSSRTLGGSRPGPPTRRLLPITLGQVFQRIDILSKDFDNIVELQLGTPWPIPPVEISATLAHKFEIIGSSMVRITFEKTSIKTLGNLSQLPPIEVPRLPDQFRPPSNTGMGEFDVTYLDADTRITRGDRRELRVFVLS